MNKSIILKGVQPSLWRSQTALCLKSQLHEGDNVQYNICIPLKGKRTPAPP